MYLKTERHPPTPIHPPEIFRGNQRRLQSVFVTHSPMIYKKKKAASEGSLSTALTRLEILGWGIEGNVHGGPGARNLEDSEDKRHWE